MTDSELRLTENGDAKFESSESHRGSGHKQRGPFRPEVWINTRHREALRLRVFLYRGIDVFLAVAVTAYWLLDTAPQSQLAQITIAQALPYGVGVFALLALFRSLGLYSFNRTKSGLQHSIVLACAVLGGALPALFLQALLKPMELPAALIWACLMLFLLGGLHIIWSTLINAGRLSGALIPNIVLIGANEEAERLIQRAHDKRDMNVIAVFDDRLSRAPECICGVPVLGHTDDLLNSRLTPYIDTIAVMIEPDAIHRIKDINQKLMSLPNPVTVVLKDDAGREGHLAESTLERLARTPVAMLSGSVNKDRSAFFKRGLDMVFSGIALAVLAPLLLLVAALIRLDSPGPALFRQQRHGFNHEVITVWKFRTMRHESADATASRQVDANDNRITRLGRFLRISSIDELPQLLNVLRGEMSLVGPRPHAIGMKTGSIESAAIVADYAYRHRIKPGLTGWAAINGSRGPLHSAADVRRRVQLDIEYIENQGFWFDVMIILRTIPVLLGDRLAIR